MVNEEPDDDGSASAAGGITDGRTRPPALRGPCGSSLSTRNDNILADTHTASVTPTNQNNSITTTGTRRNEVDQADHQQVPAILTFAETGAEETVNERIAEDTDEDDGSTTSSDNDDTHTVSVKKNKTKK